MAIHPAGRQGVGFANAIASDALQALGSPATVEQLPSSSKASRFWQINLLALSRLAWDWCMC